MADQFVTVDEADFQAFIATYPRPLKTDVYGAAEPPIVSYNDFERAPYWPDSIVARRVAGEPGGRVLADINSLVADDGKRTTDEPTLDANGVELKVGDRVRVQWGSSSIDGQLVHSYREHIVTLNDSGTKYERLGISGCANHIVSDYTWKLP